MRTLLFSRYWWMRDRVFWLRVLIVLLALFLSASTAPTAPVIADKIVALAHHFIHALTDPPQPYVYQGDDE